MTRPNCQACKHKWDGGPFIYSQPVCDNPKAKVFSRIHGYLSPYVVEVLDECDRNEWFEEKKPRVPWFCFWRTAS